MAAISITGSGFDDTNKQNNLVKIGDVNCTVSSATNTNIICSAGPNTIGSYQFTVNVLSKGYAILNSNPTVTFTLTATSFTPTSTGTGGNNSKFFWIF